MKTDVTVIYQDKFISVDGEGLFFEFAIPDGLEECHAIQWHNGKGYKELLETMENIPINYDKDVAPYVELWQKEKNRIEEELNKPLSLEELKVNKLLEINNKYNTATSSLVSTYPSTELLTFDKQEQEARAWLEDNSVETPLIDALVEGRQIDKADLVNRIINKSDLFAVQTGYLTGQRQYYEDQLGLAQTKEEVKAIIPEYRYYEVGEVSVEA